uniref:Uncharacterized protein n=1 Tax=Anopheles christyi TaxID=43041 RepID=A0A182K4M4_9DIPT
MEHTHKNQYPTRNHFKLHDVFFCHSFSYHSAIAEGILTDNPHLVLLFYLAQLFLRELIKSHRLVQVIPMDMSGYYENRAGPSNLGNVISQILLCKQITPDFNQEELCSISKDSQEIARILQELQEFMPQQENYLGRYSQCKTQYQSITLHGAGLANNSPHDRNQRTLAGETTAWIIIQKHGPPVLRVPAQLPMNADVTAAECVIGWIGAAAQCIATTLRQASLSPR